MLNTSGLEPWVIAEQLQAFGRRRAGAPDCTVIRIVVRRLSGSGGRTAGMCSRCGLWSIRIERRCDERGDPVGHSVLDASSRVDADKAASGDRAREGALGRMSRASCSHCEGLRRIRRRTRSWSNWIARRRSEVEAKPVQRGAMSPIRRGAVPTRSGESRGSTTPTLGSTHGLSAVSNLSPPFLGTRWSIPASPLTEPKFGSAGGQERTRSGHAFAGGSRAVDCVRGVFGGARGPS
jgi:hypothetical protein